jgi:hypothetical protein
MQATTEQSAAIALFMDAIRGNSRLHLEHPARAALSSAGVTMIAFVPGISTAGADQVGDRFLVSLPDTERDCFRFFAGERVIAEETRNPSAQLKAL